LATDNCFKNLSTDGNIGIPVVTYARQLCTYVVTD